MATPRGLHPVFRPDRETARPTSRSGLPVLPHLSLHHAQCRLFPPPSLLSQYARFHQPPQSPPPSIHQPQLNAHHPKRFLSQAPTSRDPFLARQGLLCPPTKFKARWLVMAVAGHQCNRLSPRRHRLGCVRKTRLQARLCVPARAQRLSSPTLCLRRTAAAMEYPLCLLPATAATIIGR